MYKDIYNPPLPPGWYSKLALTVISNKEVVVACVYALVFFALPFIDFVWAYSFG